MDRRRFLELLALAAAGAAAGGGTARSAAAAAGAPARRLAGGAIGITAHQLDARSVRALRVLGARRVRHGLYWPRWEDAAYRAEWRDGVSRAADAGLAVLVTVHRPEPKRRMSSGERRAEWEAFARFVTARARELPHLDGWQLWNEMDHPGWTDAFGANSRLPLRERGRLYAEQLRIAYPRIKAAAPGSLVVAGGIAQGEGAGELDVFLRGMWDEGEPPMDALAVHSYGCPPIIPFRAKAAIARRWSDRVWCTEFGLHPAVIPWPEVRRRWESYQQEAIEECVAANQEEGLYDRAYLYCLWDGAAESHAIYRKDWSGRPAATWLAGHLR